MPFLESFWAVLYRKRLFFEMSEILTHPTLELAQNHLGFSIGLGDAPLLISAISPSLTLCQFEGVVNASMRPTTPLTPNLSNALKLLIRSL